MILELILSGFYGSIVTVLGLLPTIPSVPDTISSSIDSFLDLIFQNVSILNVFVPISTLKVVIPLVIIIINFDYIYKFVMWVLKKIPLLGISD